MLAQNSRGKHREFAPTRSSLFLDLTRTNFLLLNQAYKSRRRGWNYNRYDRLLHWRQRVAGGGAEAHCGFASWSAGVKLCFFFFALFRELVEVADRYVFCNYTQRLYITEMLHAQNRYLSAIPNLAPSSANNENC